MKYSLSIVDRKRLPASICILTCVFLSFINSVYSQGMYGIVGIRSYQLFNQISTEYLEESADSFYGPDVITHIDQDVLSSTSLGLGYMRMLKKPPSFKGGKPYLGGYAYIDFNSFGYEGYDNFFGTRYNEDGFVDFITWNFGISYGLRYLDKFNISTSVEYTFGNINDFDFHLESASYLSINFNIGWSKKTKLGHLGISSSFYPARYYAGNSGPKSTCTEFRGEIPIIVYGGLVFLGIAIMDPALGSEMLDDLGKAAGSSGSAQYCHVFGKIRFVEYGEDYTIRYVGSGADLKVRYVSYSADSVGEWQTVDFGEDYKLRVVEYGEDFTVRSVQFGEGCNK